MAGVSWDNLTLSTILRFHDRERLPLLGEAISSLAAQDWEDFEAVVALQNPDAELAGEVGQMITRQAWAGGPRFQIVSVEVPPGVDGRSELLNRGLARAAGRFVAFLDDDDVVYERGYSTLVGRLLESGSAIAVGGYTKAHMERRDGRWVVTSRTKSVVPPPSRLTLFRYNYIPLHSYVIDRSRLGGFELYFDNDFPPLEDYDFLLRLFALFEPDFTHFGTPVCEYRIHELNSIGRALDSPEEQPPALRRAHRLIAERKRSLACVINVAELAELAEEAARLAGERERLLHRVADRAYAAVGRHPRLRAALRGARALFGGKSGS